MSKHITFCFLILVGFLTSCGSNEDRVKFQKEPLDILIKKYSDIQDFSIILYDMDYNESSDAYQHQYRVLYKPVDKDTLLSEETEWHTVSDVFFDKHKDNMGMEIASKKEGVVKKIASPPGYSNYVGNEKYGHWKQRSDGSSFWEFYGKYAFMSSMFRMAMFPVTYGYWNDYRTNYYGYGRPYYGPTSNGYSYYGSNSKYNQDSNKSSKWNKRSSSFKNKVRSRVTKSATATKSRRSARRSSSRSSRSRSSSRYRGSSSRSRGGGFGK